MNEAGRSVGPARGSYKLALDRVLVMHDEIDLPFGDIRVRLGGGLAGHNGLKSLKRELGGADFQRVRVGVGRPDTTDPEIVSAHVLGKWRESAARGARARRARPRRGGARCVLAMTPRDWDAATYERLSAPLTAMGTEVLDRLVLRGDETVLDAGCGTGNVTRVLLRAAAARTGDRGRRRAVDGRAGARAAAAPRSRYARRTCWS